MAQTDWPEVRSIYAAGIATRNATFETELPAWGPWDAAHSPELRLVAVEGDRVVGWAAAAPVSARRCYAGVVESSVYIGPEQQRRGIGRLLLDALIRTAEQSGCWTIQAATFPENIASVALHEACGFRIVGIRERLGLLDGVWRDVLLLERRSPEGPRDSRA
jgi:phosphinothricin acetyltransferase